ncbi:hypothetical protein L210DRAFT_949266, partial [Boletus edulis BED1]
SLSSRIATCACFLHSSCMPECSCHRLRSLHFDTHHETRTCPNIPVPEVPSDDSDTVMYTPNTLRFNHPGRCELFVGRVVVIAFFPSPPSGHACCLPLMDFLYPLSNFLISVGIICNKKTQPQFVDLDCTAHD